MSKYGPATLKQIDNLITFMEDSLLHREFTPTESANMRQILDSFVHIAQLEAVGAIGNELKNNLNEENAPTTRKHVEEMLKNLSWLSQPPPF